MKKARRISVEIISVLIALIIFGTPFFFVILMSFKDRLDASEMLMTLPQTYHIIENYMAVIENNHFMILRGFKNSAIITVFSLSILVIFGSMAGYLIQRRGGKIAVTLNYIFMIGLMMPPAIVPTIWVLQGIGLFKTFPGIILVEVALFSPFTIMIYKGFMATIPRELDEAAVMDGCGRVKFFWKIIFPLLKPVTATATILSSVNIFNDFVNPLYFFTGAENITVQTSIYSFMGEFQSSWNLVFADVVLVALPPFIFYLIFSKQIIGGMTAGAIKG